MAVLQLHQVAEPEIKPTSDIELRSARGCQCHSSEVEYVQLHSWWWCICLSASIGRALLEL